MKLVLLLLDEVKNVLQIVTAFELKNRAEKNTFAATMGHFPEQNCWKQQL